MSGNNNSIIPSRVEADLIVRHFVDEFVSENGDDTVSLLTPFTATLSSHVGRLLDPFLLDEVITLMHDVALVADFDHVAVIRNKALTVNNQPEVLDYYTGELVISVNNLLDAAGFENGWVNGSGRLIRPAKPTTNHLKAAA
jgi:hypothetical protein